MSADGWMDKEIVIIHTYTSTGIFSLKSENDLVIDNNMYEPGEHFSKWNKADTLRKIPHEFTYNPESDKLEFIEPK